MKDDNTSAESSKRKKKNKRLDGMLESMNSRSDPVSTHRIATEYFQSFKVQRNIKESNIEKQIPTAVSSAVVTSQPTAVLLNNDIPGEPYTEPIDLLHTQSEDRVYKAISSEIKKSGSNVTRVGLKKLKMLTGLSDKTIRVSIHNLEKKKSIRIEGPSIGIYGRMYSILQPEQIIRERKMANVSIDRTTKSILPR